MIQIKAFTFNFVETNCYVVWDDTNEAVIIDAGCFYDSEKSKLKEYIEENKLTVRHALNTHLHFDHIFGAPFVEDTFGTKVEANDADIPWLNNIKQRVSVFGIQYNEQPRPLGRVLHDGDTVTFGTHTIRCLQVPGHSPGSIAYYLPDEDTVFTGDALFRDSIGRTDFPDGSYQTLCNSIRTKLFTLPDRTVVYPGHGDETTIGYEKENNEFI